tara:strand:+ start:558 stop:761 length:204 start_codon:yes stop_codon:yes gene_type:complete
MDNETAQIEKFHHRIIPILDSGVKFYKATIIATWGAMDIRTVDLEYFKSRHVAEAWVNARLSEVGNG